MKLLQGDRTRKNFFTKNQLTHCATNFVAYLREIEAMFENALACVSGTKGKLFNEKKTEVENRVSLSL
jgi:hypothetical protein